MASGQAFVVGSGECTGTCTVVWSVLLASCLFFVMVAKLTCLVWCLQLAFLAFPYARCEISEGGVLLPHCLSH